jgi:GDPmannose 4,6-dehydratase
MTKTALITGITGQDGAYLAELLLDKGYTVHGIKRRTSLFNTDRIDHLYQDPHVRNARFILHYGDMTDSSSLIHVIEKVRPDEVYNLAAQSHVAVSFEEPEYTANSDALGTLRLLEAIRILGLARKTRFYQASTSELYGLVQEVPQKETTPFYPRSPYAAAKLYAYWITVNYREAYGMYACNGILFNHECVTINTPLVVRVNGVVNVVTAGELIALRRKGPNIQRFDLPGVEVWDGRTWTSVLGITATKRRKDDPDHALIAIQARGGVASCTAHHKLIRADETEDRADALRVGEHLLLAEAMPDSPAWTALTPEMAEFLGLMTADGYVPDGERNVVQFTNNDESLQRRVAELWSRLFLGSARFSEAASGLGPGRGGQTYLSGAGVAAVQWLRFQLYSDDGFKRVPVLVLNAPLHIQAVYLNGYYAGAGLKAGNGESIRTNSALLAQGLFWLYANQGRVASVYLEQRSGRSYYQLNLPTANPVGEKGQHLCKLASEVRRTDAAAVEDDEWIVDLATESGRFVAGVGGLVVHNSPIRGETFVTRKITRALARIRLGLQDCLYLGNLNARRDWGHARDYVEAMWLMLQQDKPEDFVIATGEQHSVREFVDAAAAELGLRLRWEGSGVEEAGVVDAIAAEPPVLKRGQVVVRVDPRYFRPTEVETLLGDPSRARTRLGWKPQVSFPELVAEMVREDLRSAERDELVKRHGHRPYDYHE